MLSRGARKIVFVQPALEWPAVERRKSGVLKAISQAKQASCDVIQCKVEENFETIQTAVDEYFVKNGRPDAILGATDAIAIAALRYCQDNGYSVPGDIKIAGFNGFSAHRYTNPTLTTIKSPAYEMGLHAGSMLLERLKSKSFAARETSFPVTFVKGGST